MATILNNKEKEANRSKLVLWNLINLILLFYSFPPHANYSHQLGLFIVA